MSTTTTATVALAPRERQVIQGLADGRSLADVSDQLKIAESTAAGYLRLAKNKLGVSRTPTAIAVAYATGDHPAA